MHSPLTDKSAARSAWRGPLVPPCLLLILTALLYLPGTGVIPLMDRDEPRFAHATAEMMQQQSWLLPYFNSDPAETDAQRVAQMKKGRGASDVGFRFDKPPLTYWWMRLHYALLGMNELAARLHSVLSVWLVSWVVFAMGKRICGVEAGWWGALGWLTSFQSLVHGRLCVADMPMVLCVAMAMWSLVELLTEDNEPPPGFGRWWWMLWGSLGLGFLAKGPITLCVPVAGLLIWRLLLWRKPVPWARLRTGWGVSLALAIIAAWGIPALMKTEGMFWKVGMGEHVVQRGAQAFNGRAIIPGYYFVSAFLSLLPWIVFLPQVVTFVRRNWSARTAMFVAWFAAPQLIFLFYATQLPHYTMPGFPAFFVIMGLALQGVSGRVSSFARWFLGAIGVLALVILATLYGGGITMDDRLLVVLACVALVLGSMVWLGFAACLRSRGGMLLACAALAIILVPLGENLRSMHPAAQLSPQLRQMPAGSELIAWQFTEPSLVFYADKPWTMYSKIDRVKERIAKGRADAVVLLIREWTLSEWWKRYISGEPQGTPLKDFSREVEELTLSASGFSTHDLRGLNLARSSWVEVRLLLRD